MGKSKTPSYAKTTVNTGGLFGSSTSDKKGTTFNPEDWQSNTMEIVGTGLPATLNSMMSNDYTQDPNFQAYQNNFNRQMNQAYDANVLSQLANRGLMRSSGLQAATNSFADTLADNEMNLYDNYYNRQANNLSSLLNTSNNIYNQIMGINQAALSNTGAVNNYNMEKYKADKAANSSLYNTLANGMGTAAGLGVGIATGNPFLIGRGSSKLLSGGGAGSNITIA